ncbi:MAG: hypothetical protein H0W12_08605 [Chitinophagaceae bacterium]|nr:hypothetical protein [Chitinophagaceae bacterium]
MRYTLFFILIFFAHSHKADAQIFKRLGDQVKATVRGRADRKVDETINKAIDSLGTKSKKKEKNTQPAVNNKTENKSEKTSSELPAKTGDDTNMEPQDGYIQAKVFPDQTLTGASLVISGETMYSDKIKEVSIVITPPKGAKAVSYKTLINKNDGSFKLPFNNTNAEGNYSVKVNSPDGKASKDITFTIYDFGKLDQIATGVKDLLRQSNTKLKEVVSKIKEQISSKDAKEIDEKMKETEEKIDAAEKMLTSINDGCGKLGDAAMAGKGMPENVRKNMGELNDVFKKQEEVMKEQVEKASHAPADNTVCEVLVWLDEVCAAFSTVTNFYAKTITKVLGNIVLDKAIPKMAEVANKAVGDMPSDHDFWVKEPSKILATAIFDAKSLETMLGKGEITADVLQYGISVLLKRYCGTYKGELQFHYENIYSHEGDNWWKYTYDCGAAVSLRYPINQTGGIIKMKGNIEGNATNFTFGYDVKHMLPKNVTIYDQRSITPLSVPFVTSQHDALGFGGFARAAATPSYFNLTVDAEYNTETETITFFYNTALVDFTPAVANRGLIMIIAANIPIIKYINFPINKMGKTFGATLKRNSEFKVTEKGTKILGSGDMSIGQGSAIEHKANFTLTATKE